MEELDQELLDSLSKIMDLMGRTEEEALFKSNFNNLSRSEMHTLVAVGPYERVSMSETAERLGVTAGTLSVQVDRLVKKDYLIKQKREDDRRVNELALTRKGRIAVRVRTRFISVLLQHIMEPLDSERQEFLADTLGKIEVYLDTKYREYKEKGKVD